MEKNEIVVFKDGELNLEVPVGFESETVFLTANQMAQLFEKDEKTIRKHINNVFADEELERDINTQKMRVDGVKQLVPFYTLDVIISVGYRVKSKSGVAFRKWANGILKDYLINGYAINKKLIKKQQIQLESLKSAICLVERSFEQQIKNKEEAKEIANILKTFSQGLELLDNYDHDRLDTEGETKKKVVKVGKEEFLNIIKKMKSEYDSDVFAIPKDESFDSSINQIYQSFDGKEIYPTLEEKAAMLLYFITKNHSFADGNKRIAASCFVYFLEKNNILYKNNKAVLDNATLFSLTLLIATSKNDEVETMKQVILSILNNGGKSVK